MNTSKRFLVALPLFLLSSTHAKTPNLPDGLDPADDEAQVYEIYRQASDRSTTPAPIPKTTQTSAQVAAQKTAQQQLQEAAQRRQAEERAAEWDKREQLAAQQYAAQQARLKAEQTLKTEQEALDALEKAKRSNTWWATGEAGVAVLVMGTAIASEVYDKSIKATIAVIAVSGGLAIDFVRRYRNGKQLKTEIADQKAVVAELKESQQH